MRLLLGLALVAFACGPLHREPTIAAPAEPAPPALVAIDAVTVVRSADEAAALRLHVPAGFDFARRHLVAIPAIDGDGRLVEPASLEVTEEGLILTVVTDDPDPPPCCGAGGCYALWEQRRHEYLADGSRDGHLLVAIDATELPVRASVEHPPPPLCLAPSAA
jgi:hypothetical protein